MIWLQSSLLLKKHLYELNLLELPPFKNQQVSLYRSVSLENSVKQLKHYLTRAIREIKHSACGLNVNKALGFASCFISRI